MNRHEFETLRDLPDKEILSDIAFTPSKDTSTTLVFEQVKVSNSLGYDLVLNGSYIPDIPQVKFNFVVRGVGPICRIEVNGKVHRRVGRTHKHYLMTADCPRLNLPEADTRLDLDLQNQTTKEIWEIICQQANITHRGEFKQPR
jgi:hypothetical protein